MKLGIIGASGKIGRLLVLEALNQGYDVTAIVRDQNKVNNPKIKVMQRDIFDITPKDLKEFDVVINAFNAPLGKEEQHLTSIRHLINVFKKLSNSRLMVVGGAGSLYVDKDRRYQLMNTKDFPEMYKPTAFSMSKGLDELKKSKISWTYLSPAAIFDFEGRKNGYYTLGSENYITNADGESYISYADYAVAMIDEIKNQKHINKRFSVIS